MALDYCAVLLYITLLGAPGPVPKRGQDHLPQTPKPSGRVTAADGLELVFTAAGSGPIALVFIHGGMADRSFWTPQIAGLADRYRVVALDLAGHGESDGGRKEWTIARWADDVRALVEALSLERVVLVGNSLGGPVALEAAPLLPGRVLGVVGVDTFHDARQLITPEQARARAEAFRTDFGAACRGMVEMLFHPGAHAELHRWAEERMCSSDPRVAVGMMQGWGGYELETVFRRAGVPIRAINGDLWPTAVERNRTVVPGFSVSIMKGAGHYPMLERPEEFNRLLTDAVEEFVTR